MIVDIFAQTISLNWTAALPHGHPILNYQISGADGTSYLPATELGPSATVFTFPYTDVGIPYAFRVRANNTLGYGEWSIDDGTGSLRIDDLGYDFGSQTVGVSYQVTAPLFYSYSNYKLVPRSADDVVAQ